MKLSQRLSVITIGAEDLERMKDFYTRIFGWQPITANEQIVFFSCNGFLLSLCDRKNLAGFIGVHPCGLGFRRVTFGYNVRSKAEVEDWFEYLLQKEVNILKAPTEAPFGAYFLYFTDVEGNILEIAFNPYIPLDQEGNAVSHLPLDLLDAPAEQLFVRESSNL